MQIVFCVLITFGFLWPNLNNGWVNWDDQGYVLENHLVRDLSWNGIQEIFSKLQVMGLYHPITVISLAIDHQFSGNDAFSYHLTNTLFHLVNVALVYLFIHKLAARKDMAIICALLFGIHPMHVESVAWISARKDVLYTFFFLLALLAYLNYLRKEKKIMHYLMVIILFCLSVLSKVAVVVLPLILLLIDYLTYRKDVKRMILEKIPFLVLSILFGIIAISAQQEVAALAKDINVPYHRTIFVAIHAVNVFTAKCFIPYDLSPFYPMPFYNIEGIPNYIYWSVIPFATICIMVWKSNLYTRKILFGFLFFLISLGPTLQLLPVGRALMAERYSYVSYIGLFYLIALMYVWLKKKLNKTSEHYRLVLPGLLSLFILTLGMITFERTRIWTNGGTLWTDVVKKYPDHYFGYANRGDYWYLQGNYELALRDMNKSISIFQGFPDVYNNRGRIYQNVGKYDLALTDYNHAISIDSMNDRSLINRAILLLSRYNQRTKAERDLKEAIRINPYNHLGYLNLGVLFEQQLELENAENCYSKGIDNIGDSHILYQYRGLVRHKQRLLEDALSDYDSSLSLNDGDKRTYYLRAKVNYDLGRIEQAKNDARMAQQRGFIIDETFLNLLFNR